MPTNLLEIDEYTAAIPVANDGEDADRSSLEDMLKPIGNRLNWFRKNVTNLSLMLDLAHAPTFAGSGPFTGTLGALFGEAGINFPRLSTPDSGSSDSCSATILVPRPRVPSGRTVTMNGAKFYFGEASDGNGALIAIDLREMPDVDSALSGVSLYYGENTLVSGDFTGGPKEWDIADFDESATGSVGPHTYGAAKSWVLNFDFYPKARSVNGGRLRAVRFDFSIT